MLEYYNNGYKLAITIAFNKIIDKDTLNQSEYMSRIISGLYYFLDYKYYFKQISKQRRQMLNKKDFNRSLRKAYKFYNTVSNNKFISDIIPNNYNPIKSFGTYSKISTQPHYHGILRLSSITDYAIKNNIDTLSIVANNYIKKINKSFSVSITAIYDIDGWADYILSYFNNIRLSDIDTIEGRKYVKSTY